MSLQDVEREYTLVTSILTDTFSPEQLLTYIAARRNKPLGVKLVQLKLPPGTTGCAVGLVDADVIGIRRDIEPERYFTVLGHECGHFLLKHVPLLSAGAATTSFNQFINSPDIQQAILRDRANDYHNVRENNAEKFGRKLAKCFERHAKSVPDIPSDIFIFS